MRRALLATTIVFGFAVPAQAEIETYFGFQVGIGNAPPPPVVVYREQPEVVRVRGSQVYVVEHDDDDCDMFRYGRRWYVCRDGRWYRASRYDGPYRIVDVRRVPRPIFHVPADHWRHHPHRYAKRHGHWSASHKERHGKRYKHH